MLLQGKYHLWPMKPGEVRSRIIRDLDKEMEITNAELRIDDFKNNPRNWRYSLNLKGLLLYLIGAAGELRDSHNRGTIAVFTVIVNTANNHVGVMDLDFLHHFDVFNKIYDRKTVVEILTNIALELKHLLHRMTREFLREYIIIRCYEEVRIEIEEINSLYNNPIFEGLSKLVPRKHEDIMKQEAEATKAKHDLTVLQEYKLKILNDLIPIENEKIKRMKEDLKTTKETILA